MENEGYSNKTIKDEIGIVTFLLKKNEIKARLPKDEVPAVDEEAVILYSGEEIRKLWAAMNKLKTGTTQKRNDVEIANDRIYILTAGDFCDRAQKINIQVSLYVPILVDLREWKYQLDSRGPAGVSLSIHILATPLGWELPALF